jgi:hypothetical protein
VSSTGVRRIGRYIGDMPTSFATIEEGEHYFRTVLEPYGYLSDEHWRHLAIHSLGWDDERKRYAVLCDPSVAKAFNNPGSIRRWISGHTGRRSRCRSWFCTAPNPTSCRAI